MKVTHDTEVDAAYVTIVESIEKGEAAFQLSAQLITDREHPPLAEFILDLDRDGKLLGIEVLGAISGLRSETLRLANPG
jgi:uncharacterized protein YuzE